MCSFLTFDSNFGDFPSPYTYASEHAVLSIRPRTAKPGVSPALTFKMKLERDTLKQEADPHPRESEVSWSSMYFCSTHVIQNARTFRPHALMPLTNPFCPFVSHG
jgi:hypothetical protein